MPQDTSVFVRPAFRRRRPRPRSGRRCRCRCAPCLVMSAPPVTGRRIGSGLGRCTRRPTT